MKALRKFLDKQKPKFQKGGKLHKLESTFDAFETFLFVPNTTAKTGAHIRDAVDMKRFMFTVIIAMIPALIFGTWNVGYEHYLSHGQTVDFLTNITYGLMKVLPLIVVSYGVGLGIEFLFAQIRHEEVNEGFLVSGMLIPLIVPPDLPLWQLAIGVAFAVIFGKEVFGGTGMNVFNPALTARAFIFFAYPGNMSGDKVWIADKPDTFSGATPLGNALVGNLKDLPSAHDMFFGYIPGSVGETSTFWILVGAVILLLTGVASWRVMVSVFAGGAVMGLLFNLWGANTYMEIPFWQHFIMGGFAFGAVFMATDPVTSSQTTKGKYIYGFLIGFIAVLIRVINPGYPEGVMLSILLMNAFAPFIDHLVVQSNIKRRLKRATVAVNK
ncbi:MAG: NADH:ubiquinone reductase (Na(+)-transporting) subunit B [Bacteroidales bacterium]|nr:NADH:ubiquinone reductase (Na(+)-transporting) subunit B [Bacteroidales bacterium]